jgi:molecular chaperone Hsp31 and glyoxalase 3
MPFYRPFKANKEADGSEKPSTFALAMATEKKTKYVKQEYEATYTGNKPILVVMTDEALMEMENKKKFSTGNHPVEALVPMLHFKDAGFTFDFATLTGGDCKLEMWAFPKKDENVKAIYEELKEQMDDPKKLADIPNLDEYSAIFVPGGHGCMINLPHSKELGRLLHYAHDNAIPTVTLCHGPGTLLSTKEYSEFAYNGYEMMCFTDKTDKMTPSIGYLPGAMPWQCQASLEKEGVTIMNKTEKGDVHVYKELITGDSPYASHNLGVKAAPIVVKWANENRA